MLRGDALLRTVITGNMEGKKTIGRLNHNDAELDDGGRLWKVERRGSTTRRDAASYI